MAEEDVGPAYSEMVINAGLQQRVRAVSQSRTQARVNSDPYVGAGRTARTQDTRESGALQCKVCTAYQRCPGREVLASLQRERPDFLAYIIAFSGVSGYAVPLVELAKVQDADG